MGKSTRISNGGLPASEDPRISVQMQVMRELKRTEDEIPISPRSLRWVNDLFPLLETYNFSSVEIVSLVKRCEYNSEQIQIAVSGILEQALGHEQGEWKQVKNRKHKKEEQISKERMRDSQDRNSRHVTGHGGASSMTDGKKDNRRNRGGGTGGSRGRRGDFGGKNSLSNRINRAPVVNPTKLASNTPEKDEPTPNNDVLFSNESDRNNISVGKGEKDQNLVSFAKEATDSKNNNIEASNNVKYVHLTPNKERLNSSYESHVKQTSGVLISEESHGQNSKFLDNSVKNLSSKSWAARLIDSKSKQYRSVSSQPKCVTCVSNNLKSIESFSTLQDEIEVSHTSEVSSAPPPESVVSEVNQINEPCKTEETPVEAGVAITLQPVSCEVQHSSPLQKSNSETVVVADYGASISKNETLVNLIEPEEPVVMPRHHIVNNASKKCLMFGTVSIDNDCSAEISATDSGDEVVSNRFLQMPPTYSNPDTNAVLLTAVKMQPPQEQSRLNNVVVAMNDKSTVDQQCQTGNRPNIIYGVGNSLLTSKVYNRNNAPNNSVKYVNQKTQVGPDIDMCSSLNDHAVSSSAYSQEEFQRIPAECNVQQHETMVDTVGAFHSKQFLNSASVPATTSVNACVQTYVSTQERKSSEAGCGSQALNSRSGAVFNGYLRGVAPQNYSGQTNVTSSTGRGGGASNTNANFLSQRPYGGNSIQVQHQHQLQSQQQHSQIHQHQLQSSYQHSRCVSLHDKMNRSYSSSWYDQQLNRTNHNSELLSNVQYPRNVSGAASLPQQSSSHFSSSSSHTVNYSRPPPPLPTMDPQCQAFNQQASVIKNANNITSKSEHSFIVGQQQQCVQQHHGGVGQMTQQQQQHAANVYGGNPYSSAPPGLTSSGAPTGMNAQAAFNYGYPNMGYPPYNLPAYSGGYGQPMIPQYGMMGGPFNDKGRPGMHGVYPNQYGMGYGESFDDPSSLPYSNMSNGTPNDVLGFESVGNNQTHFQASGQQSIQGTSSSSGSSSCISNSVSPTQCGPQMQHFNSVGSPSINAICNSNYGNNGVYGQSYSSTSGTGFLSAGQNAPPGFGSGYNQKDGRSSSSSISGLGSSSNVQTNSCGYFSQTSSQSHSNVNNVGSGISSGSRASNNNIVSNSNTWENHCSNQSLAQNQYFSSSNVGNQGGGIGYSGVPYSSRGGKLNNYSYSSSSAVSGHYSNCNYGNRLSVGGNGQNNDASQGYYSYGGYNQFSSNLQGQYSSQNPPGLGGNYYTGQQFQHSGGHYSNRNGQGCYGGYNNVSMWNNS